MLKLHRVFLIHYLILYVATLLLASILGYWLLKQTAIDRQTRAMQQTVRLLTERLPKDLQTFAAEKSDQLGLRLTIVDSKGGVVAESDADHTSPVSLEQQPEIEQASKLPFGVDVRRIDPEHEMLFVAHQTLLRGHLYTVRLGVGLEDIWNDFYRIWKKVAGLFVLFTLLAYLLSLRVSRNIKKDMQQIFGYLDEIGEKNYRASVKIRHYQEFLQLAISLKNFAKKLDKRDRQRRKHTARMRLVNKQRNDILSAISHEFKNPVASIIGYAETLQEDLDAHLKIRERFLGKIISNARKITMMIDRLALSVKLENNDLKLNPSSFDLCELIEESVHNTLKRHPTRAVSFSCEPCVIYADRVMLDLVITNLLDNAMKYSEEEVEVSVDERYLSVMDKGIGIAEAELAQITDKFYRVEKNTWDNSMGLGLAIVSYILKLHSSKLEIRSEVMEGSTFRFQIATMKQRPG